MNVHNRNKKKLTVFLALLSCTILFSQNNMQFNFSSGTGGLTITASEKEGFATELKLLNIYMYDRKTGIGLIASPCRYYGPFLKTPDNNFTYNKDDSAFSFINLNLNINLLKKKPHYILGPFTEINFLSVKNIKHYEFSAGFQFSYFPFALDENTAVLSGGFKTGFKIVNNKPYFFVHMEIDAVFVAALFIGALGEWTKSKKPDKNLIAENTAFKQNAFCPLKFRSQNLNEKKGLKNAAAEHTKNDGSIISYKKYNVSLWI